MTFHHTAPAYVEPHVCEPPGGTDGMSLVHLDFGLGTIWQCDECQGYWELRSSTDYYGEYDCMWHSLSKRAARVRLRRLQRRAMHQEQHGTPL